MTKSRYLIPAVITFALMLTLPHGAEAASKLAAKEQEPPPASATASAQAEAVKKYPQLGESGSAFNLEFVRRVSRYQKESPDLFKSPQWPVKLADEVAQAVDRRAGPVEPEKKPSVTRRVLVINIDPLLEDYGNERLSKHLRWNDPHQLTADYFNDITAASGGYVQWQLVAWVDLDVWPKKEDGFQYTDASYLRSWSDSKANPWHTPDSSGYEQFIDLPLPSLNNKTAHQVVASGEVDEVIWWAGPYFGFYESRMIGKTAYGCNSPPIRRDSRLYVVMGLNPERGVAEALHSFGHRCEAILGHVYGGWSGSAAVNHLWDRFTRVGPLHSASVAGCGNVHFPPNASKSYEYSVPFSVKSNADNWLSFPNLPGTTSDVGAASWAGPDYQRNFLRWWMTRFPKAPGRYVDPKNKINNGKLNNWWSYIVDMNSYKESR